MSYDLVCVKYKHRGINNIIVLILKVAYSGVGESGHSPEQML